jgi:hypothetical protein
MKLVPSSVPAADVSGKEKEIEAKNVVHRRIEVTVERETVSVLVPGRFADCADGAAGRETLDEGVEPTALAPVSPAEASVSEDQGRQGIRKSAT